MDKHTLTIRGNENVAKARGKLTTQQIDFAQWLALPYSERIPKTQKDYASQVGVSEQSLCDWKKIPELWQVRDDAIGTKGKELVTEAMAVLEKMLKSPNLKIASEAAKDILDRWAEPVKHAHIIASIKDMYEVYHD